MHLIGIIKVTARTRIDPVILPIELSMVENFEFTVENNTIIAKPAVTSCPFCGRIGVIEFYGHYICLSCLEQLKRIPKKKRRRRK
jgi:hypothetical protein